MVQYINNESPMDSLLLNRDYIEDRHDNYDLMKSRWGFYLRSYLGGEEYRAGKFLHEYALELDLEFQNRTNYTPIDNHCRNIIAIYSSFLFRVPPTREYGTLANEPSLESFLSDADLDGQNFNAFMKNAQTYAAVYGNVWIFVDKPESNAMTRADELGQDIRPYMTMVTPDNIFDWHYSRAVSGRYYLDYIKVREEVTSSGTYFRLWTPETISYVFVPDKGKPEIKEIKENQLGMIPVVCLYNKRSPRRGLGISDLTDVALLQQSIYNELSEMEQLIRLSNHPSLVKTQGVEASAGAGSIISMPDDLESGLKPYLLQPSGSNLSEIRSSIEQKIEMIDRATHMSGVRQTKSQVSSGIALQTEFENLNSALSEKADLMENAEEQIWDLFAKWQGKVFDGVIDYPESFNLRDYASDLQYLQQAKASGVRSSTFQKEIDKQIVNAVIDDDAVIKTISDEIDQQTEVGTFETAQTQIAVETETENETE
tara:strand:+ start:1969 stop:3420 length:1452 start_codon:yes stop_codon:yes gene_type:complete